jgi:FkbM family methyltransferase
MKKIKSVFHSLFSRIIFQKFWEKLFYLSLKGLNYGNSDSPSNSGEKWIIQNLIKKSISSNEGVYNIFNVGANVGQYCDLLIELLGESFQKCNIFLFEPQEECFEILKLKYGKFPNINIFCLGLGSKAESKYLYRSEAKSVQASIISNPFLKNETEIKINMSTIDIFSKENLIDSIDYLIIDVEGYELNVLQGAMNMLKCEGIKFIQFEHGSINSIKNKKYLLDFFNILPKHEIFHIKQNGIVKINYKPELEIYYNTNYFALQGT